MTPQTYRQVMEQALELWLRSIFINIDHHRSKSLALIGAFGQAPGTAHLFSSFKRNHGDLCCPSQKPMIAIPQNECMKNNVKNPHKCKVCSHELVCLSCAARKRIRNTQKEKGMERFREWGKLGGRPKKNPTPPPAQQVFLRWM